LFLRSFKNDQVDLPIEATGILDRIVPKFTEAKNLDQALMETATPYGPVVAIGRPGDPEPPFGASRKYVGDDEWQALVKEMARDARRVVIVLDTTEGVVWEREMLHEAGFGPKTLFLFDPSVTREEREALILPILAKFGAEAPEADPKRIAIGMYATPEGDLCVMRARSVTRSNHLMALNWSLLDALGYPPDAWAHPNPKRKARR
jgi:hypothetical protein